MNRFAIIATAAAIAVAGVTPLYAVDKSSTATTRQVQKLKGADIKGTDTGGGVGPVKGGATVSELSAHECRTLGGTVVHVADDRCGSTRKYCRMPDTLAACIDEVGE